MRQTIKEIKDRGLSAGLKAMLNEKYKTFGRVLEVEVDTTAQRLTLLLDLIGETEGVELVLTEYAFIQEDKATFLRLGPIETSRGWMTTLLNDLADRSLDRRRYPIENATMAGLMRTLL
ncbi:MAG: hypothetical protein KKB70_11920 [Proteobacteria bacterium]|nr:hypothetical protein [Pseudomonadota bacterium]MBU1610373.1 hypothetical protein [Pseudomonadota bacterium]